MAPRSDPQSRSRGPAQDRGAPPRGRCGRRREAAALTTRQREHAPAKINLHLHVTGQRDDGYHLLDSLVVFASAGDLLEAVPADTLSLEIGGPFASELAAGSDNLVLRAAEALRRHHGIASGARLRLMKNLPVASGIGGGSADAAATLRALATLWDLPRPPDPALALSLGADVPVCLENRPVVMRGVGEILHPAPRLPAFALALVNPRVAVPTPAVFRARGAGAFRPRAVLPQAWENAHDMARDLAGLANDLEAPALAIAPVIADVLADLRASPGCLLARMSGSGATCFGIFAAEDAAARAADRAAARGWWATAGKDWRPESLL